MAKKYRFVLNGNNALYTLQGSRKEIIRDDMGSAVASRRVPPVQLVFTNGYAETDSEAAVKLIQMHRDWGRLITWHPTCMPKDATPEDTEKAKTIAAGSKARIEGKIKGIEAAREGSIPKEE